MRPFCIGFLPGFCCFFVFDFLLGCVYLCFHLPCTFVRWVPILDFYSQGFFSIIVCGKWQVRQAQSFPLLSWKAI
jgi:hypothetical protein